MRSKKHDMVFGPSVPAGNRERRNLAVRDDGHFRTSGQEGQSNRFLGASKPVRRRARGALGFLPGTLAGQNRSLPTPSLRRPLRPARSGEKSKRYLEKNVIEDRSDRLHARVEPLNDSFWSSWTKRRTPQPKQMKMFVTRPRLSAPRPSSPATIYADRPYRSPGAALLCWRQWKRSKRWKGNQLRAFLTRPT